MTEDGKSVEYLCELLDEAFKLASKMEDHRFASRVHRLRMDIWNHLNVSHPEVSEDHLTVDYPTKGGVIITHLPSGMAEHCDSERSMIENKKKAWKRLRPRISVFYSVPPLRVG